MGRSLTKQAEIFDIAIVHKGSALNVTWTTGARRVYAALVIQATPLYLVVARVVTDDNEVQEERLEIGDFIAGKFTLAELTER